jgi:hypothetical protein
LRGPEGFEINLKFSEQFIPQAGRNGFDVEADLVFVGYGIGALDLNFDEYRNVDVKDKIVVVIRREPQQENPDSVFDGKEVSSHSWLNNKIGKARAAGAIGVILVNDGVNAPTDEKDQLEPPNGFASATGRMPFIQMKRRVLEHVLRISPLVKHDGTKLENIADIEKLIDETLEPVSQPISGWKASISTAVKRQAVTTSNIIGVIEGEGPLAEETIVIGGHYDHLGLGAFGSRAPERREIHNGADDNATGTAAVMELARRFGQRDKKPARRLVFICFSAEEMGLLGANHYVTEPIFPLDKTVAMVNFDMIGWLRDDNLSVFNATSAPEFDDLLDKANEGFDLKLDKAGGFAGSDHLSFYQKNIPVMFFHTGLTSTYHTPDDDFETIDCGGALKVIDYSERVIDALAAMPTRPTFAASPTGRNRAVLGVRLDDENEKGIGITDVSENSVAEKAGLKIGDVITHIDGEKVSRRRDVNLKLRGKTGKSVKIKFLRGEEEMEIEATFPEPQADNG